MKNIVELLKKLKKELKENDSKVKMKWEGIEGDMKKMKEKLKKKKKR